MTTFFRLLKDSDKASALRKAIANHRSGNPDNDRTFQVEPDKFRKVPNTPFAYWVDDSIRDIFSTVPQFERDSQTAKCGLGTLKDFRFLRLWWEVSLCEGWRPYFDGGHFSPFFEDFPFVVNWKKDGIELKEYVKSRVGSASRKVQSEAFYGLPGLVFPRRSRAFSPKFMPAGGVFSNSGQAVLCPADDIPSVCAFLNSTIVSALLSLSQGSQDGAQFEVGLIQRLPFPDISDTAKSGLHDLGLRAFHIKREIDRIFEHSRCFGPPDIDLLFGAPQNVETLLRAGENELLGIQETIDAIVAKEYLPSSDVDGLRQLAREQYPQERVVRPSPRVGDPMENESLMYAHNSVAVLMGIAFGRWDARVLRHPELQHALGDPLSSVAQPPASVESVVNNAHTHAAPDGGGSVGDHAARPDEPQDGGTDERGRPPGEAIGGVRTKIGVIAAIHAGLQYVTPTHSESAAKQVSASLKYPSIEEYVSYPRGFFADHLQTYSLRGRKAPIYWPLSTASGSYTIWLYYQRLDETSLFTAYQLAREKHELLEKERVELQAIPHGERTKQQQKRFDEVVRDVGEVHEVAEEILRITRLPYKPDHDDGVPICAAPLYKLFRHNAWSKYLKGIWEDLESGKYDWAHLAYAIWPDRVREKAREDKSIAIAHRLEREA